VGDAQRSAYVAEDAIRPVIGYREWVLVGDELYSPLARTPWHAGTMRAECLDSCRDAAGLWRAAAAHSGPAPDPGCVCGLYALFAPARSRGRERLAVVHGAIVLWGRIELHRLGMRAEYARIVALALPNPRRQAPAVAGMARLLGVEAVPARDLTAAALRHGDALEPTLVPP
jgi:hypothetical protein